MAPAATRPIHCQLILENLSVRLTDGLTSTAPSTSRARLGPVLLQVGPVCVARAWVQVHRLIAIVLLPLVLVHDAQANWRAQCNAKLGTRLDLDAVLLVARGGDSRLTRSPARHLRLDVVVCEGHTWRAAVDDGADGEAM
jgi:hypothetical protein